MAKCPVHRDRMASLEIKEGKNSGTTIVGCYAGCSKDAVLAAVGLRLADLFADSSWKPSPAMMQVWRDEEELKRLEHQYGLCIMAKAVFLEEQDYWSRVEQNLFEHVYDLRCKIFPSELRRRICAVEVQRIIAEYGIPELMECVNYECILHRSQQG